jgi:hypothetical protein
MEHQRSPRAQARPGTVALPSAAVAAAGVVAAFTVLLGVDVHDAAGRLHPLITTPRGPRGVVVCPSTVDDWGRTASDVLRAVQIAALGPRLRPTDHLRYRTMSPSPRQPEVSSGAADQRARRQETQVSEVGNDRIPENLQPCRGGVHTTREFAPRFAR